MRSIATSSLTTLIAATLLWSLPAQLPAWAPNASELDTAIKSGDFSGYLTNSTAWLNEKAPAGAAPSEAALDALQKDPVFAATLSQRTLIFKAGADKLGAFAKADPANQQFLSWLFKNTEALDRYLEGCVPLNLAAREQGTYGVPTAPFEIWKKILAADPDSKTGLYLRLAVATSLAPPGTGAPGAGQAKVQADPVERYLHFKTAHQNKELFSSFDQLSVWELCKVTQSGGSNEDLAWARQMINAWRPDLRINEMVVNSTSEVWRRNSPISHDGTYKNVLAGGGKCGPRSSWSVFICQAFGIPAIGVGQPAHACVAYKTAYPMTEPQPGSAWKVGYGRGWQVSKLEGMGGVEFLACVQDRCHNDIFSKVEHLRWFASALTNPATATAIKEIAKKLQQSVSEVKTDVTASLKAEEAEKEIAAKPAAAPQATAKGPVQVAAGTTRIDAAAFTAMQSVNVVESYPPDGKQINYGKSIDDSWVEYSLDVATAGSYLIQLKVAAANVEQVLKVKAGAAEPVIIKVPWTTGLWDVTEAAEIKLDKGPQTLRISTPNQRGVALRSLELKSR